MTDRAAPAALKDVRSQFAWSLPVSVRDLWRAMYDAALADTATPTASFRLCVLGLYMGAWSALAMGMATWLRKRWALPVKSFLLLVLPIAWATGEWLRGTVLTGFPWSASGYAHNAAPLGGYAALIGVYGIGLLAALCGACLAMITQRARWFGLGLLAAILAAGYGLRQVAWTHPQGQPMSVRLLQGNVPTWSPRRKRPSSCSPSSCRPTTCRSWPPGPKRATAPCCSAFRWKTSRATSLSAWQAFRRKGQATATTSTTWCPSANTC